MYTDGIIVITIISITFISMIFCPCVFNDPNVDIIEEDDDDSIWSISTECASNDVLDTKV